jgi:hypothetical protein
MSPTPQPPLCLPLNQPIFDNSRAIILTCLGQYGWLSNLIEILWPLTF